MLAILVHHLPNPWTAHLLAAFREAILGHVHMGGL